MSFDTNVQNLATRISTECKSLRTLLNGNLATVAGLNTTAKTDLVAAINEVLGVAEAASAGATDLDGLTDVAITTPATGHVLRHNGTQFVNALGTTYFDAAGAAAAAQAASQPADPTLDTLAAKNVTAYGANLLELANQAALMLLLSAATTAAAGVTRLSTTAEATTGTATNIAVTPAGLKAALDALVGLAPGTLDTLNELAAAIGDDANFASTMTTALAGKQAADATLTALAGVTTVANKLIYATAADTFATTDLTAFARTLLSSADNAAARTTLDVWSKSEVGSVTTDYVAIFNAGLV